MGIYVEIFQKSLALLYASLDVEGSASLCAFLCCNNRCRKFHLRGMQIRPPRGVASRHVGSWQVAVGRNLRLCFATALNAISNACEYWPNARTHMLCRLPLITQRLR